LDRRAFIGTLAGGLLAAPLAARAQPAGKVPRIGVLSSVHGATWDGFRLGLLELGYTEGRTILIEWRWTEGKAERAPELAAELVRLQPDVLVTSGPQPSAAGKAATATIPIVFIAVADPRQSGARRHSRSTRWQHQRVRHAGGGRDSRGKWSRCSRRRFPRYLAGGHADQSHQRDTPTDRG
jgi:ABC-type uncharacterized transport system substrate-binding protein